MISKHISDKEAVYSTTALRRGIDNKPNEEQLGNMKLIAEKIFEPLRSFVGGPIKVNSFLALLTPAPSEKVYKAISIETNIEIINNFKFNLFL